jgi:hypothetical protein
MGNALKLQDGIYYAVATSINFNTRSILFRILPDAANSFFPFKPSTVIYRENLKMWKDDEPVSMVKALEQIFERNVTHDEQSVKALETEAKSRVVLVRVRGDWTWKRFLIIDVYNVKSAWESLGKMVKNPNSVKE